MRPTVGYFFQLYDRAVIYINELIGQLSVKIVARDEEYHKCR
jgi:hypothetical protein